MPKTQRVRRIAKIPKEYLDVVPVGVLLFPVLFQFENALRLVIHRHMSTCYTDWWETKLRADLPDVYEYVEGQKKESVTRCLGLATPRR